MRKVESFPSSGGAAVGIGVRHARACRERRGDAPHAVARPLVAILPIVMHEHAVRYEIAKLRVRPHDRQRLGTSNAARETRKMTVDWAGTAGRSERAGVAGRAGAEAA